MVPRSPSPLHQLSSLLSQTTCTLVSCVVKPDGDEPNNGGVIQQDHMISDFELTWKKFCFKYNIIVIPWTQCDMKHSEM